MSALDESPLGTDLTSLDGRWLRVNHAFARIVGYTREELTGMQTEAITHPADVEIDHDVRTRLARGEVRSCQRVKRYLRQDGSIVFVKVNVSVVRDDDDTPLCFLTQVEDITARLRAEEALRRSESNLRRLFDQATEGILVADLDGRYTDANAAGCELLGYAREELVGKTMMDLVPMEDAPRLAEAREQTLVPGMIRLREEWRHRRKDGVFIWVELSSKFLLDGREVAFVRDVSERKRAEREREESFRWVRAVLEQSPVGLILCPGPLAARVESNTSLQQMTGCSIGNIEQLRGMLRTPDGQPIGAEICACVRALRGERTPSTQLVLHDARGSSMPVVATAAPIFGADGTVLGGVVALQDVSATRELERLRAEWSSVVAHDLRQPLATISLSAEAVARLTHDSQMHTHFGRIRSSAERLTRMVGDLMDLSRLEASRLELVRQFVDVPALVRACVERAALGQPGRAARVRVDGDIPEADADPDRIAQVMENLLCNAVKYGRGDTPIFVDVARAVGGEIAVSVTNEGRALDPEELSRLFQRFQRTSSAKLQGIAGTGLGLYITRSLVEAHGGRITAECTAKGTMTFQFTLPAAPAASARAAATG
jgi:PAS domain S-box-containing protein